MFRFVLAKFRQKIGETKWNEILRQVQYVYINICVYIYLYVHVCVHKRGHVCISGFTFTYTCTRPNTCTYMDMSLRHVHVNCAVILYT